MSDVDEGDDDYLATWNCHVCGKQCRARFLGTRCNDCFALGRDVIPALGTAIARFVRRARVSELVETVRANHYAAIDAAAAHVLLKEHPRRELSQRRLDAAYVAHEAALTELARLAMEPSDG